MLQSLTAADQGFKLASLSPLKARQPQKEVVADQVSLGQTPVLDPALSGPPKFPTNADAAAEKPSRLAEMSLAHKAGVTLLAGLSLMTALTGCTKQAPGPAPAAVVETQTQKDARSILSQGIADLEKEMASTKAGDGHQQAEQFTSKFFEKVGEYTQKVGQDSKVALNGIQTELRDHPAMAATVVFALGTASGIALEHYGIGDNIKDGVANIVQAVKDHPIISIGVGAAAAVGIGALVQHVSTQINTVKAEIPAKPQTAEAKALEASFSEIEQGIKDNNGSDAKTVTGKFMDAVSKYKDKTHKAWSEVASDVKAFAFDHPILSATVVAGAGVGTGILLEKAGVPKELARVTESMLSSGKDAASSAIEYAKAHPLVTGVGAAVVAAGVGYLAYEYFQPAAAPAAPAAQ